MAVYIYYSALIQLGSGVLADSAHTLVEHASRSLSAFLNCRQLVCGFCLAIFRPGRLRVKECMRTCT